MKKYFIKFIFLSVVMSLFNTVQAQIEIPSNCELGRSDGSGSIYVSTNDFEQFNISDSDPQGDTSEGDVPEGDDGILKQLYKFIDAISGFEYLRIEGPKHVIIGESNTFKANLADPLDYVSFYNSEDGYVGRDKSNEYANAYLSMSLGSNFGARAVWVENDGLCSLMVSWVQSRPNVSLEEFNIIQNVSVPSEANTVEVAVNYSVSRYSKFRMEDAPISVTIRWINQAGVGGSKRYVTSDYSGEISTVVEGLGGGDITFSATVYDGTFINGGTIGVVSLKGSIGPIPCNSGDGNCHVNY